METLFKLFVVASVFVSALITMKAHQDDYRANGNDLTIKNCLYYVIASGAAFGGIVLLSTWK